MTASRRLAAVVLRGIVILLLLLDSYGKMAELAPVVEGSARLAYPANTVFVIGFLEFCCIALFAVPRTSVLGGLFLTGYLGGAVASHLRIGDPWFTHVLAPVYMAIVVWAGLLLSDHRVRALIGRLRPTSVATAHAITT